MSTSAAVVQLHNREMFERNVTRALGFGAAAGALHLVAHKAAAVVGLAGATFPASDFSQVVPLSYLAVVGAVLGASRGDRMDKILLGGLAFLLPAIPFFLGMSIEWTVGLAGAAGGGLMVRAALSAKGEEGQVGEQRPGLLNYALGMAATGGLAVAGNVVAKVLATRFADFAMPTLLNTLISGVVLTLFVAIGSIASHLALKPDPVLARCEELLPKLAGEFHTLAEKAISIYRACGQSLSELPREPAREELARVLGKMTLGLVELAHEWAGVEAQLASGASGQLSDEIADLEKSAASARDPIAKKQLEAAALSLREEQARFDELGMRRERILAKLKAEAALLERARVSLIGARSGQAQLRAAELSAMARKFKALSTLQSEGGRLADAVAVGKELSHQEASAAIAPAVSAAAVPAAATVMEPIATLPATPADSLAPAPKTEKV